MRSWERDIFRDLLSKIITAKAENRKYGIGGNTMKQKKVLKREKIEYNKNKQFMSRI